MYGCAKRCAVPADDSHVLTQAHSGKDEVGLMTRVGVGRSRED